MKFIRKDNALTPVYSKAEAITELKNDRRVKRINSIFNRLTIYTNPIIPQRYPSCLKPIIGSIGEYKIIIVANKGNDLNICMSRLPGGAIINPVRRYRMHHPHIVRPREFGGICWGNISSKVWDVRMRCDWYWLSLYALDLLEDCSDYYNDWEDIEMFSFIYGLILDGTPRSKKQAIAKKAKEIIKNSRRLLRQYRDEDEMIWSGDINRFLGEL